MTNPVFDSGKMYVILGGDRELKDGDITFGDEVIHELRELTNEWVNYGYSDANFTVYELVPVTKAKAQTTVEFEEI